MSSNPPGVSTDDSFFNELNKHRGRRLQRLTGGDDSCLPSREHLIDFGNSNFIMPNCLTPDPSVVHDFARGYLTSSKKSGSLNEMHEINSPQSLISATNLMLDDESEPSYSSSQSDTSLQSINEEYLANESPPLLASPASSEEALKSLLMTSQMLALYPAQVSLSPGQSNLSNESPPFFESPSTSPERKHKSEAYSAEELVAGACKAQNGADECNRPTTSRMGMQQQQPLYPPGNYPIVQLQFAPQNNPGAQRQTPLINVTPPTPPRMLSPQHDIRFLSAARRPQQIPTINVCPPTPPRAAQNSCGPRQSLNSTFTSAEHGINTTYSMRGPTHSWGREQWRDVAEPESCSNSPQQMNGPITMPQAASTPLRMQRRQWASQQQSQSQCGPAPAQWAQPAPAQWAQRFPATPVRPPQMPSINVIPPTPPQTQSPQSCCRGNTSPVRQIPAINVIPPTPPQALSPQSCCRGNTSPVRPQQTPVTGPGCQPTPQQAQTPQSCGNTISDTQRRQWVRPPVPQTQCGVPPAAWAPQPRPAAMPQAQPPSPAATPQAQPFGQANKLTMQGECRSSMKQKVLYDSLVRDQYAPGIIQCTLAGNADFNKTSFDLLFGVDVPRCQPEVEPLSLLEAFYLRINFEREQMFGCYLESIDIETHFSKQHPTELNNSIASLFRAEKLEAEKNPKAVDFTADIKSTTVTLQGSNMSACIPIILSNFTGSTKSIGGATTQPPPAEPAAPAAAETPAEPPAEEAAAPEPAATEEAPAEEAAAPAEEKAAE